jgi:hypothetical protein
MKNLMAPFGRLDMLDKILPARGLFNRFVLVESKENT